MTFMAESAEQYTFISMEFLTQLKSWFSGWIPFIVGLAATAVFWFYRKPDSGTVRKELNMFLEAARAGTESSLKIGATVGVIGIIIGMVKALVETVLAMARPEIEPKSPRAITETFAGPPVL